ncbi:MAG: hypothetical protein HOW73_10630 [Polyangiaceae bacterium]|nr:hypothetical protein [Polyangiaceae bacterium]
MPLLAASRVLPTACAFSVALAAACGHDVKPDETERAPSASAAAAPTSVASASASPTASAAPPSLSSSAVVPTWFEGACSFDWVELDEAFRTCPAFGDVAASWTPRVRTHPKELRVASGEMLKFTISLGNEGREPWTAELDDHCGLALRPLILDSAQRPVDDPSLWLPPACPSSRARVTMSRRGMLTQIIAVRAVRRERYPVVVGHRTSPGGAVTDIEEQREREVPLVPGKYFIELLLPTLNAQSTTVEVEVTRAP